MTGRIFRSVVGTAILSVLLATVLIVMSMFDIYENEMTDELRAEAGYIHYALQREEDEERYFEGFASENRVTLIAGDGSVLYDSSAEAGTLDNHALRPEVRSALENGWGESERYSDTLAETTYYYALRTDQGNVLRVANTRSSVLGVFMQALPLVCCISMLVALLSLVIARLAAANIVAPLNALNLDEPMENKIYDELAPLLTRMDRQRGEIRSQMRDLDEARRELNAITRNMREGMILIDSKGSVLTINASACRIFGVKAGERVGRKLLDVSSNPTVRDAVEAAQRGESADAIMESSGRFYRVLANPVSRSGRAAGVVLLVLDVTERYTAELSRKEFTANVSHELKTPLTSISGYAEIIRDGVARPEDISGFAARIHAEASCLLALINDILELARLDEHRSLGEKEDVQLLPLVWDAVHRLERNAQEKNIGLYVQGDDLRISGYGILLNEMVYNLVDNAVKYTPSGGRVDVTVEAAQDCVKLSVRDSGIGIPREHQPHIFERFYRVDKSHSRATGGTGLGLSIVKHVAEIHDARIFLESEEGKGTCVSLKFRNQL